MSTKISVPSSESRTVEQLKEHYELEKQLASQLLNSNKEERRNLYTTLYDKLYTTLPHHPRWTRKSSPEITAWIVTQRMYLLKRFLTPETTYLEIGPGDCSLSMEVSKWVKKVYAVDVATEVTKNTRFPDNMEFIVSDGCSVNAPENSVDIAYSHQLMEHLHPDDAVEQLQNIYKTLAPKGKYICITPHRLSGPHDISKYFDEVARGFHLKEYTVTELYKLFRKVGFSQVLWVKSTEKFHLEIPLNMATLPLISGSEVILEKFPYALRKKVASTPLLFRGMTIVGIK
ncbi:MAG: methyltransferase domain-containing protein [Limnoraphis robusta]